MKAKNNSIKRKKEDGIVPLYSSSYCVYTDTRKHKM